MGEYIMNYNTYNCKYTYEFPIDKWGRLGGFFSLTDVPIAKYERLTRDGIIEAENEERSMYKVRDVEENFVRWIPMADVEVGEMNEIDNGICMA